MQCKIGSRKELLQKTKAAPKSGNYIRVAVKKNGRGLD